MRTLRRSVRPAAGVWLIGIQLGILSLCVSAVGDEHAVPLFDGDSLRGWTRLDGRPPHSGWRLDNGVLHLDLSSGRAGHLISERRFGDFRLTFDWKIADRGNSGLKYRVRRYKGRLLGCEYQLLDDPAYGEIHPKHSAGALYALYEPVWEKHLRPVGEYNSARIEVVGDRIRHWLNGQKIVDAEVGSDDWRRRVAISKFAEYRGFGQNRRGRLMITDHGSEVWYRNFRLNEFPTEEIVGSRD